MKSIFLLLPLLCACSSDSLPDESYYQMPKPQIKTISLPEVPCQHGRDCSSFEEEETFFEYLDKEPEGSFED